MDSIRWMYSVWIHRSLLHRAISQFRQHGLLLFPGTSPLGMGVKVGIHRENRGFLRVKNGGLMVNNGEFSHE